MSQKYAHRTKVPTSRSREEIERTLKRYGAQQFVAGWDTEAYHAVIGFTVLADDGAPRQVRLRLPLPSPKFGSTAQCDAEERRRWRALVLVIKAKLEAVDSGISTVEHEFMADVVLPNGKTLGEWIGPQLAQAYGNGKMPKLLPGAGR